MCIAVPGQILSIDKNLAEVDFSGNIIKVDISLVDPKPKDYVLVHAGCAIEIIQKDQAEEMCNLLKEIEDAFDE